MKGCSSPRSSSIRDMAYQSSRLSRNTSTTLRNCLWPILQRYLECTQMQISRTHILLLTHPYYWPLCTKTSYKCRAYSGAPPSSPLKRGHHSNRDTFLSLTTVLACNSTPEIRTPHPYGHCLLFHRCPERGSTVLSITLGTRAIQPRLAWTPSSRSNPRIAPAEEERRERAS